jgi:hypothetical protein
MPIADLSIRIFNRSEKTKSKDLVFLCAVKVKNGDNLGENVSRREGGDEGQKQYAPRENVLHR